MSYAGATAAGRQSTARRAIPLPGPRLARRVAALAAVALILVAGYLFWLRDSSLVRVQEVTVTGLAGEGSERVRIALTSTATGMTTLHVDRGDLERAVAAFPIVRAIEVTPDFPSGMRIHVLQHRPAAVLASGARRVPVAADGTVLAGLSVNGNLPLVKTSGDLPAKRIPGGAALDAVRVAGGLPGAFRSRVEQIGRQAGKGMVVPLEDGPQLIFGDATRIAAKWAAAVRVLADPDAGGAAYIDLRIPERPAAGGLPVETVTPVAPAAAPTSEAPVPAAADPAQAPPASAPSTVPAPTSPDPAAPVALQAPAPPARQPVQPPVAEGGGTVPNAKP